MAIVKVATLVLVELLVLILVVFEILVEVVIGLAMSEIPLAVLDGALELLTKAVPVTAAV